MFSKIIVPLDGSRLSEQIVPYAGALAKGMHIPLKLLHVVDPAAHTIEEQEVPGQSVFLEQLVVQQQGWARVYMGALAKQLEAEGMEVETAAVVGTPEQEIVAAAGPDGEQLIAMATHGRAGIGRMVLGSITDRVMHLATTPMLLFRPRHGLQPPVAAPRTIIVPLDGSALAERAMALAQYFARSLGARLLMARVVPHYSYVMAAAPLTGGPPYGDDTAYAEKEAASYLADRERDLTVTGVDNEALVLRGDPAQELVKLASTTPDCLTVMSTHGRSGFARLVLGSVADAVVRQAGTPVLLYRMPVPAGGLPT